MSARVEVEREVEPWCYACGRPTDRVVVVQLPCPWCTVDVFVKLCFDCARKLAAQLYAAVKDAESGTEPPPLP